MDVDGSFTANRPDILLKSPNVNLIVALEEEPWNQQSHKASLFGDHKWLNTL